MSDDTLNAGSDEELPADETVGTDDSASQETTEESTGDTKPTGREKALKDTEAALAERKAEFTRMSQQLAELRGQLTTLTQLQSQRNQQPAEEKDWMEELDEEKVVSDPKSALKFMRDQMRREIASVLEARDAYLANKLGSQASIDPEVKAKVEELRNDPDFSDLPDAKLVSIAKKMGTPKKAVMQPRGSVAGSRSAPAATKKDGELSAEELAWLRASGVMPSNKRTDTLE